MEHPNVVVLGGPNGAGKSTAAPLLLRDALAVQEFVNADEIARGLSAFRAESVALRAGRALLERLDELARARADFAFETTLASRSFAPRLADLASRGYLVQLVFLWLPSASAAVERVASRTRAGGHSIPPAVVRRRYGRSIANFQELYRPLSFSWHVYDNSDVRGPRLVARGDVHEPERVFRRDEWSRFRRSDAGGAA